MTAIARGPDPAACSGAPDLERLLGHLLRRSHLAAQRCFAEAFADTGISPLQYALLSAVHERPGIGHAELAGAVATAATVVTTALKPLLSEGLVKEIRDPCDARLRTYKLSVRGAARLAALGHRILASEHRLQAMLSEGEATQLKALLRKLTGAA